MTAQGSGLPTARLLARSVRRLTVFAALCLLLTPAGPTLADEPSERGDFAPPETPRRYMPSRDYDLQHVRIEIDLDWHERSVRGKATNVLSPLVDGQRRLTFHAKGLDVSEVRLSAGVGGSALRLDEATEARSTFESVPFSLDPSAETLTVNLPRDFGPDDLLSVEISYSARPQTGLWFVGPEGGKYPDKPRQIWTQGETEYSRHWFPSWDYPSDRTTSELVATVEDDWTVVGNGRLLSVEPTSDGRKTFHWVMEQEHPTYLTSIVAGELTRISDTWRGIPVEYYVPPGYEDKARRSFGRTPEMLEFFSDITGHPYPYAKYAQTAAVDFIFGGMENITATTQTLSTLHDERAALDVSSEGLVAHELAHQWFGDLVTCRGWSHAWLNEGFATYYTALWFEHDLGADGLAWAMDQRRSGYLSEDSSEYRRPIVTNRYDVPFDLFDAHLYQKGSWIVHMARRMMGEDGFQRAIALYLERHGNTVVTTDDLRSAFEDASGVNLGPLFDGYVYGAGHPEIEARWTWQAGGRRGNRQSAGAVVLELEQVQAIDETTGHFAMPLEVALLIDDELVRQTVTLGVKGRQTLHLFAPKRPRTVIVDPDGWLLKELDFDKPAAEWIEQLRGAPNLSAKLEAVRALGKTAGAQTVDALDQTRRGDAFWFLRAEAAKALGEVKTLGALAALETAATDDDSRIRSAAIEAMANFPEHPDRLLPILEKALTTDRSYSARAAAAKTLGKLDVADAKTSEGAIQRLLVAALDQDSHREVVRSAAIGSLAERGALDHRSKIEHLAEHGAPQGSRGAAMRALATLAKDHGDDSLRGKTRIELERYLDDPSYNARRSVIGALETLGDPASIPPLDRLARTASDERMRGWAKDAAIGLRKASEKPADDTEVETLQNQMNELRERLESLTDNATPNEPSESDGGRL